MNPRILLVEDDPTSRAFLLAATQSLPADVDVAVGVADALALATRHAHALWLIDAHLPDGSGAGLLARLRDTGLATPAIAHTASHEDGEHEALRAAGFAATIAKPLPAARWQAAIRDALAAASPAAIPVAQAADPADEPVAGLDAIPLWDDAVALAALGGSTDNVAALRRLFLDELPDARDTVVRAIAAGDDEGLRAIQHRLRASCGFVGAARLDAALSLLRDAPASAPALRAFLGAAQEMLSPA